MAVLGIGTKVYIGDSGDGSGTTLTALPGVTAVTVSLGEASEVESTNMDSPNNFKQFIAGLKDPGETTIMVQMTGATIARVAALIGSTKAYEIYGPDENGDTSGGRFKVAFNGFVKSSPVEVGGAEAIPMLNISVRVVGAVTPTASASLPS